MTVPTAPTLRVATPTDSALLAALARRTFLEAFGALVPEEAMTQYLQESFATERVAEELADPQSLFLIAEVADEAVGYAKLFFGAPIPEVVGAAPIKLWRLYTTMARKGTGVGAALMGESIRIARERGGETLWLTVNIGNERAIAFYERWGFIRTGRTGFVLGGVQQEDHVMELHKL